MEKTLQISIHLEIIQPPVVKSGVRIFSRKNWNGNTWYESMGVLYTPYEVAEKLVSFLKKGG